MKRIITLIPLFLSIVLWAQMPNENVQDSIKTIPESSLYSYYKGSFENIEVFFYEKTYFPNQYQNYYLDNLSEPSYLLKGQQFYPKEDYKNPIFSYIQIDWYDSIKIREYKSAFRGSLKLEKYLLSSESMGLNIPFYDFSFLEELAQKNVLDQHKIDSLDAFRRPYETNDQFSLSSPKEAYKLTFEQNMLTYQNNESCDVSVLKKDKKGLYTHYLSVSFKSWIASVNPLDYYWISDNELVLKVFPVREFVKFYGGHLTGRSINSRYIKMKIL